MSPRLQTVPDRQKPCRDLWKPHNIQKDPRRRAGQILDMVAHGRGDMVGLSVLNNIEKNKPKL